MRKTPQELQDLMIKNNVSNLWSWSKYHTYQTDPYGYLLKYILKTPEDKLGNAYAFMGGFIHSLLEDYYDNKIDREDMLKLFDDKIFEQQFMDIRFDASDDDRNDSIGNKYVTCIKHFLNNYEKDDKAVLEQFVYLKVGKHLFHGYVDKMHAEDKVLFIDDFKTSTIYTGKKAEEEKGQLFLYAIAMAEMYQVPYEMIKARWNFLKYVSVECEQVNGKIAVMNAERHDILNKLRAKLKTWFTRFKYSEEDFEKYFEEAQKLNQEQFMDVNCLQNMPQEIQDKFKIKDCLVEINFNKDEIENFKNEIQVTCDEILKKVEEYSVTKDDHLFWVDVDKSNSYYFLNLCGYSTKLHAPLKKYMEDFETMNTASLDAKKQDDADAEFLKSLLLGD